MALFQELTRQGRVVGGHLANGSVQLGGATAFSQHGDLTVQHPSTFFKRTRINAETVRAWEEIDAAPGVVGRLGDAAARAGLPGRLGKAAAGLGAAVNSGHVVRIFWRDDKESIVELPRKLFLVLTVMLADQQIDRGRATYDPYGVAPPGERRGLPTADGRGAAAEGSGAARSVVEQIEALADLHARGILTDAEFSEKKAELLKRL